MAQGEDEGRPSTPIAVELHDHFARGGSTTDGVRLVEALERALISRSHPKESTVRGSRLPPDWQPSDSDVAFARDRGLLPARIGNEVEKFRNYWTAKSGKDATKRDWPATWRNWIIKIAEQGHGLTSRGQGPGTDSTSRRAPFGYDPTVAGMARLAAKRGLFG